MFFLQSCRFVLLIPFCLIFLLSVLGCCFLLLLLYTLIFVLVVLLSWCCFSGAFFSHKFSYFTFGSFFVELYFGFYLLFLFMCLMLLLLVVGMAPHVRIKVFSSCCISISYLLLLPPLLLFINFFWSL